MKKCLGTLIVTGATIVGAPAAFAQSAQAPLSVGCGPASGEMLQPAEHWRLSASGGSRPYAFTLAAGELPSGLSLDAATGRISGTPDGKSGGRKTYVAKVTDSQGAVATADCSITIAPPPGWQIRVCRGRMEAHAITLRVGIGGLESSHRDWTTWTAASDDVITVPTIFRYVRELWIEGAAIPDGRNAVMCVLWNRGVTKALEFDGRDPNEVSREDHDSCSC
jgi:hypothetical protein